MINSSARKLALSGWLQKYDNNSFSNPLKLQKFLFFYEAFSKLENDNYEFKNLKAYKNGPVFSDVYGDYTKERSDFETRCQSAIEHNQDNINFERACSSSAILKALTEKELSELTHKLNFWNAKKPLVDQGYLQINMNEEDINENDIKLLSQLESMFSYSIVKDYTLVSYGNINFFIKNTIMKKMTPEHYDVLLELSEEPSLMNPVYVDMSEEGVLLID
ncbi:MAG: hypothetical protein MJ095_00115 [Oscillospiraceae bacterium]|nr:hypothetical protein [Oscillospiraceae bacterium]